MDRINKIAHQHGLSVVEDAAHAPGAEFQGRLCGTLSDVGCFSFFSNKNLAVGEGGMVTTDRDDLAEKIRLMRSHGMTSLTWDRHRGHAHSYDVVQLGYNYRLDEMRAAIGLEQLKKLLANNERRGEITARYRRELESVPGLCIPFDSPHGQPSFHIFPILLNNGVDRDVFIEAMKAQGIQTSVHYPPIHQFSYYRKRYGYADGFLPLTEQVGQREVTLPLYPGMSDQEITLVGNALAESLRRQ
jgi:dTDP-4-amino-4,6-dideoxygalactose transaminase